MSFRERQRFHSAVPTMVIEREEKILDTGEAEVSFIDQCVKKMPSPELFDLDKQLKAGITPEEVNSKVMSVNSVSADSIVRKYAKKSTTKTSEVTENEG